MKTIIVKFIKELVFRTGKNSKDDPIFDKGERASLLKPFHPAPSFWALIPLRVDEIKYNQREKEE